MINRGLELPRPKDPTPEYKKTIPALPSAIERDFFQPLRQTVAPLHYHLTYNPTLSAMYPVSTGYGESSSSGDSRPHTISSAPTAYEYTSPPHVRSEHDLVSSATETQPHDPPVFAPHMRGTCKPLHLNPLNDPYFVSDPQLPPDLGSLPLHTEDDGWYSVLGPFHSHATREDHAEGSTNYTPVLPVPDTPATLTPHQIFCQYHKCSGNRFIPPLAARLSLASANLEKRSAHLRLRLLHL